MGGYAADKKAVGDFMQTHGTAKDAWQQGGKRGEGNEAARILDDEASAQIDIMILHPSPRLADLELCLGVVVLQAPFRAIRFGADSAQWLEHFEKADVIVAFILNERKRIVRRDRVDRKMFFRSSARKQQCAGE